MDAAFQARLERAVQDRELPAQADTQILAQMISAMVHSISLRARAGASRRALRQFARRGIAILLPISP
jgi:hypothetical protein